ncbi:MAG: PilZ domain-containing protein [Pelovirga sp.]
MREYSGSTEKPLSSKPLSMAEKCSANKEKIMESRYQYSPVRENQRFQAVNRALVLIDRGPESLPYHIMDISEGGLSFRYLGQKLRRSDIKELSLYHNHELIVDKLPVKSVSDYRLRDNLVPVRRGSVHFATLSDEQLQKLRSFIRFYTEAPLPIAKKQKEASH